MKETTGYYSTEAPEYIPDPATGGDAISRIDETNLRAIAEELDVPYTHADPSNPPAAASVDVGRDAGGPSTEVETSFPLYWALVIVVFLAATTDLWRIVRAGRDLSRARGGA